MRQRVRKVVFPVAGWAPACCPRPRCCPRRCCRSSTSRSSSTRSRRRRPPGSSSSSSSPAAARRHGGSFRPRLRAVRARWLQRGKTKELKQRAGARRADGGRGRLHPPAGAHGPRPRGLVRAALVGDEPFAVMLVDDLMIASPTCLAQMVEAHDETGGNVLAVMEVPQEHTSRYGIDRRGPTEGRLDRGHGHGREAGAGGGAVAARGDRPLRAACPKCSTISTGTRTGAGGEIQLTDAMAS